MQTASRILFSCVLVWMLSVRVGITQNLSPSTVYHMETRDGNSYNGLIIRSDSLKILFRSDKLGEITLLQSEIKSLTPMDARLLREGKYWMANPQSTRYFFSPNGYGLLKGEAYYQNAWVLINSFAVGVNDYFSIGGGMVPLFLFGGPTPAWITVKASIPVVKEKFNLGAGLLTGTVLGENNAGFGIFYGIATIGSRDVNATLGAGYGFAGGSLTKAPILNLNGMCRVGPRGYLLTENYLFSNGESSVLILSFGGRTIIKNAGLDYGLVIPAVASDGMIAIPWLGITIPIGKKR